MRPYPITDSVSRAIGTARSELSTRAGGRHSGRTELSGPSASGTGSIRIRERRRILPGTDIEFENADRSRVEASLHRSRIGCPRLQRASGAAPRVDINAVRRMLETPGWTTAPDLVTPAHFVRLREGGRSQCGEAVTLTDSWRVRKVRSDRATHRCSTRRLYCRTPREVLAGTSKSKSAPAGRLLLQPTQGPRNPRDGSRPD